MQAPNHYKRVHLIAKSIVMIAYVGIGLVSIGFDNPYVLLLLGTPVWLFGVNAVGYMLEELVGQPHSHSKL